LNETEEERKFRDISHIILNGSAVDQIEQKYPTYYKKEKMMIGLSHFFHATHIGTDNPFFSGIIHTKDVDVEDYDPLIERDLIGKIVNIIISSEKPLEYIKERLPENFRSHRITVQRRKSLM
jgi:hypothetical protein